MERLISKSWKLGLGDLKGELFWITPEDMLSHTDNRTTGEETAVWTGHPAFGPNFQVKTVWQKVEPDRWEGVLSWSGYEGKLFVEEIHFPVVSAPCEADSRFLFGGTETGLVFDTAKQPVLKRKRYNAMLCSALLNRELPSVYFDHRDVHHSAKYAAYEVKDSVFTFSCIHAPACKDEPLAEYELPYVNSVGIFRGGWFEAAQIYKQWALQQFWAKRRAGRRNPLENLCMWVWNRGPAAEVAPPVLKLQEDLGKEIPVALDWYWWHHNPYDTDYPDFWPPRDGEEVFRNTVSNLKNHGVFTQVYINGLAWDVDTPSYADGGTESIAVDRNGKPFAVEFNTYTHHRLGYMCGEAPKFHDRISAQAKLLHDCGLSGQYLDQIAVAAYRQCYNPHHSHGPGASAENVEGYRKLLTRLIEENPDWPLTSEGCNEAFMDLLEGGIACAALSGERMGLTPEREYVPFFQAVYHDNFAIFGNYAMPDGIPPWDSNWPDEDRWKNEEPWHRLFPDQFFLEMARGCVWGIQPMVCNLSEKIQNDPEFTEEYRFILDTARFYHANRDLLFRGTMLSPSGFECEEKTIRFLVRTIYTKTRQETTRKQPAVLHSCWRAPSGECALILANYTGSEQSWRYGPLSGTLKPRSYASVALTDIPQTK